jgi:hypothetical protein
MRARMIDEDAPHHLRGQAKEVGAILPRHAPLPDEAQVRLVDERCRLECVVPPLAPEIRGRALPQFAVHQRKQVIAGLKIATSPGPKQARCPAGSIERPLAWLHQGPD